MPRTKDLLLNVPIDAVDYAKSKAAVVEWIARQARPSAFIVQGNVYSLVSAQEDETYRRTLSAADLVVPDGMPLVWILRLRGFPIKDRVYGPDLMLLLCDEAAKKGWKVFLYGGNEGVAETLASVLQSQFPGLQVVGTYSPPFGALTEEQDDRICGMINTTKPDIVWVGLGGPKQDIWMYQHRDKLDVSVLHGVGAAFDFLTGRVKQAPRWMMRAGLEWLFRLIQEPRRLWRRYTITNLKFFYYLGRNFLDIKRHNEGNGP